MWFVCKFILIKLNITNPVVNAAQKEENEEKEEKTVDGWQSVSRSTEKTANTFSLSRVYLFAAFIAVMKMRGKKTKKENGKNFFTSINEIGSRYMPLFLFAREQQTATTREPKAREEASKRNSSLEQESQKKWLCRFFSNSDLFFPNGIRSLFSLSLYAIYLYCLILVLDYSLRYGFPS